ncbi:hypothetical protein E5676_scaffold255G002000 [Cucumis melo var. makuwa]|uniref:Uncharacterized protein n=1 Tax=Cucumis melo var. makuwa TaxID=1194695 RepID=A0A5A7T057_CUCMM|nr:hypothetical protein E6C27_scaffold18G00150 [Cucumis melo var. makuwa]TYK12614.1 hypothetical protein E5676_scaffold255G002000 [Cucumis melo var. makuwa]
MTTINFTAQCFDRASTLLHISHSAAAATMAMEDKDNNIWRDRQRQSLIATFLKNQLRNFRKTTPDSVSICSRLPFSLSCLIRFPELLSSSPSMNHPRVYRFFGLQHPDNLFLQDSGIGFLYFPIVLKPFSSIDCCDEDRRSELGFRNR